MSAQREEPVSLELEAIARKYWDRDVDEHAFTPWGDMLTAVKEAYELGAQSTRHDVLEEAAKAVENAHGYSTIDLAYVIRALKTIPSPLARSQEKP